MCSAEFTIHYEFTVHPAELSVNSVDNSANSADFHVFKKIHVPFARQIHFSRIILNFVEFF
jgi:hypothetical protein